ncbi:MAG: hypothetical protein RI953_1153, partial [Pseudomonadota bacterium]
MVFSRLLSLFFLPFAITGCVDSNNAQTSSLAAEQKPEGFLMAISIEPDAQVADSFKVVCASSKGSPVEEKRTLAQIERNELCKPAVLSTQSQPGTGATTKEGGTQAGGIVVTLNTKVAQVSYLKKSSNLNISKDIKMYQEGLDYCIVSPVFSVEQICKYSDIEYRVTNSNLTGCLISPGFLYSAHF